jgi:protein-disulfide isomerase
MASRTKQKEEARARRLAEERAAAERAQRQRRIMMLGGVLLVAVAVVVVAIAISSSGSSSSPKVSKNTTAPPNSAEASAVSTVSSLLGGIPQSGVSLGSPKAKVTVTEYGDLECPVCRDFALNSENQLIANDVRSGRVKLVYRSLETATGNGPDASQWVPQQTAAYAAGQQNKGWYYIELFYHLQGSEGTDYVNAAYLQRLATLTPGLNVAQWSTARQNPALAAQVQADGQAAQARGFSSTPTLTVEGPKGAAQPIVGPPDYGTLENAVKSVA